MIKINQEGLLHKMSECNGIGFLGAVIAAWIGGGLAFNDCSGFLKKGLEQHINKTKTEIMEKIEQYCPNTGYSTNFEKAELFDLDGKKYLCKPLK